MYLQDSDDIMDLLISLLESILSTEFNSRRELDSRFGESTGANLGSFEITSDSSFKILSKLSIDLDNLWDIDISPEDVGTVRKSLSTDDNSFVTLTFTLFLTLLVEMFGGGSNLTLSDTFNWICPLTDWKPDALSFEGCWITLSCRVMCWLLWGSENSFTNARTTSKSQCWHFSLHYTVIIGVKAMNVSRFS